RIVALAVLFVAYVLAGKLGLSLASVHASASAVWPPTGLAIGALIVGGRRLWPAVLLGAFVVNITTAGSIATSVGIAVGNTLEALGVLLVTVLVGALVFWERGMLPVPFIAMPPLIWAAFRLGVREAATLIVILSGIAVSATVRGLGPFAVGNQNTSLLLVQVFM